MYIPAAFAETDLSKLHDFIEQNSFGLLVSQADGLPFASHLPILLDRTAGPHGTLDQGRQGSSPGRAYLAQKPGGIAALAPGSALQLLQELSDLELRATASWSMVNSCWPVF